MKTSRVWPNGRFVMSRSRFCCSAHEDRDTLLAADVQIDYREATPMYDS